MNKLLHAVAIVLALALPCWAQGFNNGGYNGGGGGGGGGANLAAPGPIGGTTPSTGQFTSIGLGGAIPVGNNSIQLAAGLDAYIQYPAGWWMIYIAGDLSKVAISSALQIHADTPVNTMARMPLRFDEGREAALAPNESMGTFQMVKAVTIENIILDIKVSPTCSVSEQIACYDCGAAAGACTTGQTSTVMSAVTVATGATRTSISEPINTANVAAGEYVSCLITAGTCTVSDNSIQMMTRPQ